MKKDTIGTRMKENYENRSKTYLTRRCPAIIRIDGKAFHTFTKGFKKPYDEIFHKAMNETMRYLCKNIQGCKIGYTQSDEITLLLTDYETITTDAWFDYSVQKMCSVSASLATFAFNRYFAKFAREYTENPDIFVSANSDEDVKQNKENCKYALTLINAIDKGALFDSRCFSIPADEVVNCFIWRQQDATKNAISMLARCYFSDKQCHDKNGSELQDMLMDEYKVNFNDMPIEYKRGVCCIRTENGWKIDKEIPVFTKNREYIEKYI